MGGHPGFLGKLKKDGFPSRVLYGRAPGSRRKDSSLSRTGTWKRLPFGGRTTSTPWARHTGRPDVTYGELGKHISKVEMIPLGLLLGLFGIRFSTHFQQTQVPIIVDKHGGVGVVR